MKSFETMFDCYAFDTSLPSGVSYSDIIDRASRYTRVALDFVEATTIRFKPSVYSDFAFIYAGDDIMIEPVSHRMKNVQRAYRGVIAARLAKLASSDDSTRFPELDLDALPWAYEPTPSFLGHCGR